MKLIGLPLKRVLALEESALIEACKRNELSAQKTLYESYLPYVLSIVRRFGVADHDSPDVIQEIFIDVFTNLKKFNPKKGLFKFWLKKIVVHKILNFQRKQKRNKVVYVENFEHQTLGSEINWQKMDAKFIIQLISDLPDGYRTVFNLYVVDGFSHREIGKMLGVSPASSRSQLSRAKQLLQKKLGQLKQNNSYGLI